MKKFYTIILVISILGLLGFVKSEAIEAALKPAKLARIAVENYLTKKNFDANNINLDKEYKIPIKGIFVSIISENNRSRGCWGNLNFKNNIKEAIVASAVGAIKQDYRAKPLSEYELNSVKFQVSVVTRIVPVNSTRDINPFRDGMMVKSGSRTGIIMPGESVDSYYQMVQCKLKAGIQPDEAYNLFKLVTILYKE
jgi:MEMO1 family protein